MSLKTVLSAAAIALSASAATAGEIDPNGVGSEETGPHGQNLTITVTNPPKNLTIQFGEGVGGVKVNMSERPYAEIGDMLRDGTIFVEGQTAVSRIVHMGPDGQGLTQQDAEKACENFVASNGRDDWHLVSDGTLSTMIQDDIRREFQEIFEINNPAYKALSDERAKVPTSVQAPFEKVVPFHTRYIENALADDGSIVMSLENLSDGNPYLGEHPSRAEGILGAATCEREIDDTDVFPNLVRE